MGAEQLLKLIKQKKRIEELELVRDQLHHALNNIITYVDPETWKILNLRPRSYDALALSIKSGNKEGATLSFSKEVFARIENPAMMLPWPVE